MDALQGHPRAPRWILAYRGTGCDCPALAGRLARLAAGRLEVVPLDREPVRTWRRQLGLRADRPALYRRDADGRVRGWTGATWPPAS